VPISPRAGALPWQPVARLQQAIADLPPAERDALLLVYQDGLTHRETAVQLNTSVNAIKVRVHRGRRRLRDRLLGVSSHQETEKPMNIPVQNHEHADRPMETCLLVDDDDFDRSQMRRVVERQRPGVQIVEFSTLAEARKFLGLAAATAYTGKYTKSPTKRRDFVL